MPGEDFDYIVDHGDVPPGAEFAVRIRDDSLEPVLHGGSVAYLNHDPLHAGDVGIFCVGGDMLCKQYYHDRHRRLRTSFWRTMRGRRLRP